MLSASDVIIYPLSIQDSLIAINTLPYRVSFSLSLYIYKHIFPTICYPKQSHLNSTTLTSFSLILLLLAGYQVSSQLLACSTLLLLLLPTPSSLRRGPGSIWPSRLNRLIAWHNYKCSSSSDFSSISWTSFLPLRWISFFSFFHFPNFFLSRFVSFIGDSAGMGRRGGVGVVVEHGRVLGGGFA